MDITAGSFIALAKLLGDWIKSGFSKSSANKNELFEALYSVEDSLAVTRSYLSRLNRSGSRSREKEEAISKLWIGTARDLRKVEEYDLADKCSLKGYYWASPEDWKEEDSKNAEIHVDQVFNDVQNLLKQNT